MYLVLLLAVLIVYSKLSAMEEKYAAMETKLAGQETPAPDDI